MRYRARSSRRWTVQTSMSRSPSKMFAPRIGSNESIARTLRQIRHGLQVAGLCPGQIATPHLPQSFRYAKPAERRCSMPNEPTAARDSFGDFAPALAAYIDKVLFGDDWRRPELSPRDRSLITVTALVALYRVNELPFHLKRDSKTASPKTKLSSSSPTVHSIRAGRPPTRRCHVARRAFEENNRKGSNRWIEP